MASLSSDKHGNRRIQFFDGAKRRKGIRLGKLPKKAAESIQAKVEALNSAAIAGTSWSREVAQWVAELEPTLYDKLAEVGLLPARPKFDQSSLKGFLDAYVARRSDVKSSTATVYGHTRRCLVKIFGADKDLASITEADADDWRRWLASDQDLAENTIRRRCAIARQFFRDAVRRRLIAINPFGDMKGVAVKSNRSRDYFLSRADADRILAACPDTQWRVIFALSRFGGLRCPSEHLAMRWSDIDWANGRMTVHSPKTERHEGKESRVIPLFAELRPHLEQAWAESAPDAEFVITRYRDAAANLRTQFERIIKRAGLKPWPKLFQNLRSARETELAREYALHTACEWIGNSQAVAARHYLQTTDEDFARATGQGGAPMTAPPVVQQGPTWGHIEEHGENGTAISAENGLFSAPQMGGTRLELVTSTV
jgi:integrase